jgi:uncharacterized membrane protein YkvA (DUF1232 family)
MKTLTHCRKLQYMTTENSNSALAKESITRELTTFIRNYAGSLSLIDLDQLIAGLPALRKRVAKLSVHTYPYLSEQLEFLSLFVEERFVKRSLELPEEPVTEAACALLYFQRQMDLIPDSIPDVGLLDDAIIVGLVLQRQEDAFEESLHSDMLRWPEPRFEADDLLSIISPLRVSSFCSAFANRRPA